MEDVGRTSFSRRAMVLLGLWAGFWLVGLLLALALLWVPVAQVLYEGTVGPTGLVSGGLGLTVLWALRPRRAKRDKSEREGLSRTKHATLFTFVEDVARRAGAAPPDRIYLTSDVQAFASAERRWFGLWKRRAVGVGLPMFASLSRDELAAVLAHEMGHHVGGDLSLGPWVYRTRQAIGMALDSLHDSAFFLDVPFRAYGNLFLRASMALSRERELAADALSAELCGARASGRALRKVEALAPLWSAYFDLDALPLVGRGLRIPLLEGFERFRAAKTRRPELESRMKEASGRPPSPWDSHPPLEERLKWLGAESASAALDSGTECLALLGGREKAETTWYEQATVGELKAATWDDVAWRFVLPGMAESLQGTLIDPARTKIEDLPKFLGDEGKLWDRLRPAGIRLLSAEGKRLRARRVLEDWLAVSLSMRGFAPRLEPGRSMSLVRGDVEVEPASVVARLANGELSAAAYAEACQSWAVPQK